MPNNGVEIKTFDIIYDFVQGVKDFMSHLLEPKIRRNWPNKYLAVFRTENQEW